MIQSKPKEIFIALDQLEIELSNEDYNTELEFLNIKMKIQAIQDLRTLVRYAVAWHGGINNMIENMKILTEKTKQVSLFEGYTEFGEQIKKIV